MQPSKKTRRSFKIEPHQFVMHIKKQFDDIPNLRIINGYIGGIDEKGLLRVYLDVELRRYVDVPKDEIVHAEDLRRTSESLDRVIIWIAESTKVYHNGNLQAPEDPTTMAVGEEGGSDPTTMATGEEASFYFDQREVINPSPFGQFK